MVSTYFKNYKFIANLIKQKHDETKLVDQCLESRPIQCAIEKSTHTSSKKDLSARLEKSGSRYNFANKSTLNSAEKDSKLYNSNALSNRESMLKIYKVDVIREFVVPLRKGQKHSKFKHRNKSIEHKVLLKNGLNLYS